jgi:hypothetical protein
MQNATINTSENQVSVNVVTSSSRVKDFTFGENNEMHIIQENSNREVESTVAVVDGLGVTATVATATAFGNEGRIELETDGTISLYYNNVKLN